MRRIKRNYTPEELYNDYMVNNLTKKQISKKYNQPIYFITRDLKSNGWNKPIEMIAQVNGGRINIGYDALYNYYIVENHTTDETAAYFNVHERTIRRRLSQYNIQKSTELQCIASKRVQEERYGALFVQSQYYKDYIVQSMVQHTKDTCLKKYGVEYVCQVDEIKSKMSAKYYYQNELFDSSWELALWIYAHDHNKEIIRNPIRIPYKINNDIHYYFPDFKYHNQIIEIKGDHLIDGHNHLRNVYKEQQFKDAEKNKCIIENNIIIWTNKEIKPYLEYVEKTYGKNYLKSFKKI